MGLYESVLSVTFDNITTKFMGMQCGNELHHFYVGVS